MQVDDVGPVDPGMVGDVESVAGEGEEAARLVDALAVELPGERFADRRDEAPFPARKFGEMLVREVAA